MKDLSMNPIQFWFKNARPISLPQSMLPAITAIALSAGAAEFNWIAALASLLGVVFLHLSLNLMDDWFDYCEGSAEAREKVANEGFRGRMIKYPYLTSGQATHQQLLRVVLILLGMAALMGVVVFFQRGTQILGWVLAALIVGVSYSGGAFCHHGNPCPEDSVVVIGRRFVGYQHCVFPLRPGRYPGSEDGQEDHGSPDGRGEGTNCFVCFHQHRSLLVGVDRGTPGSIALGIPLCFCRTAAIALVGSFVERFRTPS